MTTTYSVIIPTVNEAKALPRILTQISLVSRSDIEAIVSDGGSNDGTVDVARQLGARVVLGPRGRGFQLNRGAQTARGRILAFLHADSVLPPDFDKILDARFGDARNNAAAFPIRFDPPHPLLRFSSWWSQFDTLVTRYGDQGLVVRRETFDRAGGYPDWPLMEDVEICRRLRRFTTIPALPSPITTSSRRFIERGVWRQQLANAGTMVRFLLGASPTRLAARYEAGRSRPARDGLILFLRLPVPGKVKTRLAAGIGPEKAAKIYRRLAESVIGQAAAACDVLDTYLFVADPDDIEEVRRWVGRGLPVLGQAAGDLGGRMADAFDTVFSFGHRRVLIAGTDVPALNHGHLRQALQALQGCDLVLGPAVDGGYYLLGLNRPNPGLFKDMAWSQPTVLNRTLDRAQAQGLEAQRLSVLEDVDDAASLERSGWTMA